MSFIKISSGTLSKLNHESIEIRIRALEQLSSKLNRALALNESIEFSPGDLCKHLIRWFGFAPLQQPSKALHLLKSIIESKYGAKAISKLGKERLIKEVRKVQTLFDINSTEYKILKNIKEYLKNFTVLEGSNEILKKSEVLEDLEQCYSNKTLEEVSECSIDDYEAPWSCPSPSDYTTMKFLSDILINKLSTNIEIENAVYHLQLTMGDYPAEYLLQAPHIFQNLLHIYDEHKGNGNRDIYGDVVASVLLNFLFILERRLKTLRKSMTINQEKNSGKKTSQKPCQLKIEKALTKLLDASVFHLELHTSHGDVSSVVWDIISMVIKLLEYTKSSVDILCLYKVASVLSNLSARFKDTEHCSRLRLHQKLLTFLLQDVLLLNVYPTPLNAVDVFETILRDYTMKCFFPTRHKLTEACLLKVDKTLNTKYHLLEMYEESFYMSIKMLTNKTKWSCINIIKDGHIVCTVLDILQSTKLIDILFGGIIQGIPLYKGNSEIKTQAIDLVLKLLNLTYMPLKTYVYGKLTEVFKNHIGCLMSGERYVLECSNADLLESHIIGVPLNTEILLQLIHESFENSCDQIQSNCCKILELFLQSQTLFGPYWFNLLPTVVPLLPLLNCCTFSEKIMRLLLKLFDPDLKQLPYICVLQGNIGLLFQSNADRRSESLTRLIYTLNSLNDAENYVPNLLEISDTLPNDICLQNTPREYRNIFRNCMPVHSESVTSLNNLLVLLESPDVEPLIRKTTLMQINDLCSNWSITGELCSAGAYYLILQSLENALQKSSELDYADAAVPAISILSKVMLYDSTVRCELSETPNIYVLILRALMMFHHDIQVRQDAAICLFQLLFSSQLISTENGIEGPLILKNIAIPVEINLRSGLYNKIQKQPEDLERMFASKVEETQYWRMVVASAHCDGLKNITNKSITMLSHLDVRGALKLTMEDVRFIRATEPCKSLHRLLKAAVNSTDHGSLIQACKLLKQELFVPTLKSTFTINDEFCVEINNIFRRYLQMPPGNELDYDLYEHILDVATICLKIPLELVALEIFKLLLKDPRHALITMLIQNEEIRLRLFIKITAFLKCLINHKNVFEAHLSVAECSSLYTNLFDLFIERCLQLFEARDLQRVRCFLSVMVDISSCQLNMSDELLFFYCRRFTQLSLALKSFTQTGAQWHRDCLLTILKLSHQMRNPHENFRLTQGFIKYLSGLCGHNDVEVRILSWSILNITAKTKAIENIETESKSFDISGPELLINELSYLPGGFMACCLSTLLDTEETICVRHLAGQLLAVLIRTQAQIKEVEKLLEQNYFIRSATEALTLSVCVFELELPMDMNLSTINVTTCDLITCYSLICIALAQRSPDFLKELCTKSFMFKLYEVLKLPPPLSKHTGYLSMIGHICRLYTLCYPENFVFLQRTICRDAVWLESFCQILFGIVARSNEMYVSFNMLQLLLVLCKDSTALEQLSVKLRDYSTDIVKLFQNAFCVTNIKTSLQKCALSLLNLLLIKSQLEVDADLSIHILTLFDSKSVSDEILKSSEVFKDDNKENNSSNKTEKETLVKFETSKSTISEHLCISLIRLFTHLYPTKVCTFSVPPNLYQQHVSETLGVLLKQSRLAQETAENLKFQDRVLRIFKHFFDGFATTSCTNYVKRYGETKKLAVIKNFQLLLRLLLYWHSSATMIITDSMLAMEYSKIIIQIWPWLAHSSDLKLIVLQVCSFLSERSHVVCKHFSTQNNSSFPHSVLQLTAKMMTAESLRMKANNTGGNLLITAGLRVLMNCCSCLEGRTVLNKIHVINVFDNLYPFNPKAPQFTSDIVIAWLEFWELFSRYDEGARAHHLNTLCSVINKSSPCCPKRLTSLRVLRNMAFLNNNRSTLITSTDFIFTVNEIISQPIEGSVEEQFIVCVILWKLMSGGIKFVAMIRSTKLAKNLRLLKENLQCLLDENHQDIKFSTDLVNVLNIIFKIFTN